MTALEYFIMSGLVIGLSIVMFCLKEPVAAAIIQPAFWGGMFIGAYLEKEGIR